MNRLLKSSKFWMAVFALVQSVVLYYFDVPEQIWLAVDGLVAVVIAAIAAEDVAAKQAEKVAGGSGDEAAWRVNAGGGVDEALLEMLSKMRERK